LDYHFAATTLFSIVTLPVEYDASNRALAWLENKRMLTPQEQAGAKDSLKWAARTYVVAALGSMQRCFIIFQFIWEEEETNHLLLYNYISNPNSNFNGFGFFLNSLFLFSKLNLWSICWSKEIVSVLDSLQSLGF
jgi:hypothetical protein